MYMPSTEGLRRWSAGSMQLRECSSALSLSMCMYHNLSCTRVEQDVVEEHGDREQRHSVIQGVHISIFRVCLSQAVSICRLLSAQPASSSFTRISPLHQSIHPSPDKNTPAAMSSTEAPASDLKKVKLQSSDNESFDVDQDVVGAVPWMDCLPLSTACEDCRS